MTKADMAKVHDERRHGEAMSTNSNGNSHKSGKKKGPGKSDESKKNLVAKMDLSANENSSDADLSIDLHKQTSDKSLEEVKLTFQSKIDTLMLILESKDKQISVLSEKVGMLTTKVDQLEKGYNFLSKETSEIKEKCKLDAIDANKKVNLLEAKAQDLEDRSRRNNIVIFGVPENDNPRDENCDNLICNILREHNILDSKDTHQGLLERAQRLGQKKPDQVRPRPIIVCCGSFKDKEYILYNSHKLKGTRYTMVEDFCRATLDIRRELVLKGKEAKDKSPAVQSFQLKYKRLILKYVNPATNKMFTWGFNLKDTMGSPNWFEHPIRKFNSSTQNQVPVYTGNGYQGSV